MTGLYNELFESEEKTHVAINNDITWCGLRIQDSGNILEDCFPYEITCKVCKKRWETKHGNMDEFMDSV